MSGSTAREDLPLAGIRVLDFTMVWAGPFATKHLADYGAEVIKVEGPGRMDQVRLMTAPEPDAARAFDTSRYFNEYNRNKLGVAIDVRDPRGLEILKDLARVSDIVIENFRPGVLDRIGLGYDVVRELNPRAIYVTMPAYSSFEPERALPGYGPNVEQLGGLAHLNGYVDGPPQKSGVSYGDPLAGLVALSGVLTALWQREQTGRGQRLEVSQRNALVGAIGDAVVAHQLGEDQPRSGNRSVTMAPQGVYPTRVSRPRSGTETEWVAISVVDDDAWVAFCAAVGRGDWADDAGLRSEADRRARHDELDRGIAEWTASSTAAEVETMLQAAGVAASAVLEMEDMADDAHLRSRCAFRAVEHETLGSMVLTAPVWRFDAFEPPLQRAPLLGEHNESVLRDVLGYDPERIDALAAAGVVGDAPRVAA